MYDENALGNGLQEQAGGENTQGDTQPMTNQETMKNQQQSGAGYVQTEQSFPHNPQGQAPDPGVLGYQQNQQSVEPTASYAQNQQMNQGTAAYPQSQQMGQNTTGYPQGQQAYQNVSGYQQNQHAYQQGNIGQQQSANAQAQNNGQNQGYQQYQWSTQEGYAQPQNGNANWNQAYRNQPKQPKKPKDKNSFGAKLLRCSAYALTFGLVGGVLFQGSSYMTGNLLGTNQVIATEDTKESDENKIAATTTAVSSNIETTTDVSKLVPSIMPSIVAITNLSQQQVQTWFGPQTQESESAGSGIIIKEDDDYLYIATNNHVVSNSDTLTVKFNDDTTASAEIQGTDADNDLAVIKVKISDMEKGAKDNVKVLSLGDSDKVEVGESVIAIGNALGYGQSVTTGIISAKERGVTFQDETTGLTTTNYLIQTDAAINPGNSGGALVNLDGELIGINSSKYSDTSVEGMGFAIPVNTVKKVTDQLIEKGAVSKAYLGILGKDVTQDVASTYNMPAGVYISDVIDGSAAEEAGLSQGQIITAIDDTQITTMQELKEQLAKHEIGDKVTLTVQNTQNSEYVESKVEVTLGEYNEEQTEKQIQENQQEQNRNSRRNLPQEEQPQDGTGEEDWPFQFQD